MTNFNPLNSPTTPIAFTLASAADGTDTLGNPTYTRDVVEVNAIVTPLGSQRLGQIQEALGVVTTGIPVKVRAPGGFPEALKRGAVLTGSLEYGGQPATVRLQIGDRNPHVVGTGLFAALGHSVEGLIVVGG